MPADKPISRFAARVAPAAALLCFAASAWAQHEGADAAGHAAEHSPDLIPPWGAGLHAAAATIVIFGIVFAILAVKVWPRIIKGLHDRERKILGEIEAAEAARRQAKEALEEYERNLAQARAEAQKMLEQAKAQQTAIAAELKSKADAELTQMRDRARRDIDAAKRAAVAEIYAEAANIATTIASKVLEREVSSDDTRRLVDESLSQLGAASN